MEDFVTCEIAKKLKKNGFTLSKYETIGKFDSDGVFHSQLYCNYYETMDLDEIIAPTIYQVLKWLREKKEFHIEIYMYNNCYLWEIYNTKIYDADFTQKRVEYSNVEYKTHEQASLAGIEYVLDNLI